MSQASNDALKAAQDAVRSFEANLERAGSLDERSTMAQERLAREATLVRGEIAALRIMLSEALDKFTR